MRIRFRKNPQVSFLLCSLLLCFSFAGVLSSRPVVLDSIQIFDTHEWLGTKPTVYFWCREENKIFLPDVKKVRVNYTFKGEESWQPLTHLPDSKCKRCGLYEEDKIKSDDTFDEWELCPADFVRPNGKYIRFKDKEFNATFLCPKCVSIESGSVKSSRMENEGASKSMSMILVALISVVISLASVTGSVALYRYWQKKKREQDQARFLKLFEESDDIEDELGLGHMI